MNMRTGIRELQAAAAPPTLSPPEYPSEPVKIERSDKPLGEDDRPSVNLQTGEQASGTILNQVEEPFRVLADGSQVGIYVCHDGRLAYANSTLAGMLGYTPEEIADKSFSKVFTPQLQQEIRDKGREDELKHNAPKKLEACVQCRDGSPKWIEIAVNVLRLGDETATLGTVVDISHKKLAEESLEEPEALYRNLNSMMRLMCDNVPDLIWAKDLTKRYLFTNRAICRRASQCEGHRRTIRKNRHVLRYERTYGTRARPELAHLWGDLLRLR